MTFYHPFNALTLMVVQCKGHPACKLVYSNKSDNVLLGTWSYQQQLWKNCFHCEYPRRDGQAKLTWAAG